MRTQLMLLALFALVAAAASADDHFIIRATVPSAASAARVPVSVDFGIADMCEALEVDEVPLDTTLRASEPLPGDAMRGLTAQIDRVGEDTARVHLLLASEPAGPRQITVYLGDPPEGVPEPEPLPRIEVTMRGDAIDVTGEGFTVTHDPAKLAGLSIRA